VTQGGAPNKASGQAAANAVLTALNGIPLRMVVLVFIGTLLSMVLADLTYSALSQDAYKQAALRLADEAKSGTPGKGTILQAMQKYNLAWYYVTSPEGHVRHLTEAYNPQLRPPVPNISRTVDWKEKHYFESVAQIGDGDFLHIGFYTGPVVFGTFGKGMLTPWPFACTFVVLVGVTLLGMVLLYLSVSQPLSVLTSVLKEALPPSAQKEGAAGDHDEFDFLLAPAEVRKLAQILSLVKWQMPMASANTAGEEEDTLKLAPVGFDSADRHNLGRSYEELSETQSRISETYTKEMEDEFVAKLCRELEPLKTSHQVCQRILDKLNDKFPTSIIYGAFFTVDRARPFTLESFLGLDDRCVQNLKKIDHAKIAKDAFAAGKYLTLGTAQIKEYGLSTLTTSSGIRSAVYLPVSFEGRQTAMLAVYFSAEGQMMNERLRVLRGLMDAAARTICISIKAEEELEASRTDQLTGLRNRKFFTEIMPQAFHRAAVDPERRPISFIMMDIDGMAKINEAGGQEAGDRLLQELALTMRSCVRTSDGDGTTSPGDFLIRYGGEEFLLVMENTDQRRATDIAERIRWTVDNKADWPKGIGKITLSVGIATSPSDGTSEEELIHRAEMAACYVKDEMGRNKVCHVQKVPKTYTSQKFDAAIEGELGVFDGAALLQSLSTAQKNGYLTVTAPDGKQLWVWFESGKPSQAKLGKFQGATAIVEFITTFKEGTFNFQDKNARDTISKLPKFDEANQVKKSLERCLMDGALSQDNYDAARQIVPTSEIVVRPVHAMEFSARWEALSKLPDVPTQDEFDCMSDIVQRSNGQTTLTAIFKAMDHKPTALLWRSASLLVHHGLVQTKPAVPV